MSKLRPLILTVLCASLTFSCFAASPWTPAETNVWGWWDPSDPGNMTTNASGGVTALFDLSGNGKTLTATAGREPLSFTRQLGTNYGLDFVSADKDALKSSGWNGLGSNGVVSIYVIHDHDFPPQHNPSFFNLQDDLNWTYTSLHPYGKRTPSNGALGYVGGPYTNTHIWSAHLVFDVSTNLPLSYFNVYVDGVKVGDDKAYINQLPPDHAGGGFTLMTSNNQDIAADGGIGEVVIINDASDEGREIVEGYLAHKWGLVGNLPEDHPYEKRPPGVGPPGTVLMLF